MAERATLGAAEAVPEEQRRGQEESQGSMRSSLRAYGLHDHQRQARPGVTSGKH